MRFLKPTVFAVILFMLAYVMPAFGVFYGIHRGGD